MSNKKLIQRWLEPNSLTPNILNLLNESKELVKEYSPFPALDNNLSDFRGIDLNFKEIKGITIQNADFSFSNFQNVWMENCFIINLKFDKTDFSNLHDLGNHFSTIDFNNCKFNASAIGYNGSTFKNCIFKKCNFSRTIYTRAEFTNCKFIDCNIKGSDFSATSFEDCTFIGKLDRVWFRGGYAYESFNKEFGIPKKNMMKNVSFENATLEWVTFSNDCDLSMIKLPKSGNYQLFNNWNARLLHLKESISKWPQNEDRINAERFNYVFLVRASDQNRYLLNIDNIRQEHGSEVTQKIISILNG